MSGTFNIVQTGLAKTANWVRTMSGEGLPTKAGGGQPSINEIPKEGSDEVANYVATLYKEAITYYEVRFRETKDYRFGYQLPETFQDALFKLESGDHFTVWGTRRTDNGSNWKQQIVDNEIQRQIRVKTAYSSSGWHEIVVTPNVVGFTDILDQERTSTNWSKLIQSSVKLAKILGQADIISVLDMNINPKGVASEQLAKPNSVYWSPYATSREKADGCWYIVYATMENNWWVHENTDLDVTELSTVSEDYMKQHYPRTLSQTSSFAHTKLYPVLHLFMDDSSTRPMTADDFAHDPQEPHLEHQLLTEGQPIHVKPNDNHMKHMEGHEIFRRSILKDMEDKKAAGNLSPQEEAYGNGVADSIDAHNKEHAALLDTQKGEVPLYPNGRYILLVGGKVASDTASPYSFDYRKLFRRLYNEEVPLRIDGRSDVEILWNDNKNMDIAESRAADQGLLNRGRWFMRREEKKFQEKEWDNSPDQLGYYLTTPPTFLQGHVQPQDYREYDIAKKNCTDSLGVENVTVGASPGAHSSAKNTQLLLDTNAAIVTGEISENLAMVVEDCIQTRVEMWKQFYTEPRYWWIDGQCEVINLSQAVRFQTVTDPKTGQTAEVEIPNLIIEVVPNSNLANKWASDMAVLGQYAQIVDPSTGLPMIPSAFIQKKLQERFPTLALYEKENPLLALGLQAKQQQEAAQEQQGALDKKITNKFQSKAIGHLAAGQPILNQSQLQPQPQEQDNGQTS